MNLSAARSVRAVILGGTALVVILGVFLIARADSHDNKIALESQPKAATVVIARSAAYRPSRRYVGTILPWIEARIGPQMISAYVDTVLVRPGDVVRRGQVLATLDCRNASASSKAVAMQARAVQTEQEALADEAARVAELKEGGFMSGPLHGNARTELSACPHHQWPRSRSPGCASRSGSGATSSRPSAAWT